MAQNSTDFLYFAFMKRPITYLLTALFLILRVAGFSQNIFPPITNYTSADYGSEFAPENLGICQDSKGVCTSEIQEISLLTMGVVGEQYQLFLQGFVMRFTTPQKVL